jgi:hypothetical protein
MLTVDGSRVYLGPRADIELGSFGNLDGYTDPAQLFELARDVAEVRQGLNLLQVYAEQKSLAMEARSLGKIPLAQDIEQECERIYRQMPSWVRW